MFIQVRHIRPLYGVVAMRERDVDERITATLVWLSLSPIVNKPKG